MSRQQQVLTMDVEDLLFWLEHGYTEVRYEAALKLGWIVVNECSDTSHTRLVVINSLVTSLYDCDNGVAIAAAHSLAKIATESCCGKYVAAAIRPVIESGKSVNTSMTVKKAVLRVLECCDTQLS